ncbi:uncharacterized protein LOC112594934 [Melanaphis sacchari]|uniref:uncharacterized protein LOC112594934 n=1 Tax=Melanaphis sacchari TaxID=742174 RepID=UPI000DC13D5E|nr:uncharacterized protein LOC112594934 [Melanaphis sacchari]
MFLVHIYYITLSIIQILYVTGVSVSWNSPSTIYSSINSKSVPVYNGHSSTIRPFRILEDTLKILNKNQIDNFDTEISSNKGLGLNTNKILVSQNSQLEGNNDDSVSEYTINYNQPSKISGGSSKFSTNTTNFKTSVKVKEPELSNIYHGTNKNSETSRLNGVTKLYESNSAERGFKLGQLGILSRSIGENNKNISVKEEKEKGEVEFSESVGSIRADRKNDRTIDRLGNKEGGNKSFNESKRLIRFDRKYNGRAGKSSGEEEEGGIRLSGPNGSIRFDRQDKEGAGGFSGEEKGSRRLSSSIGSIKFGRQNEKGVGKSSVEEKESITLSGPNESIRFGRRQDKEGVGESGGKKQRGIRFSGSKDSIIFDNRSDEAGGTGGEEEDSGKFSGSIEFIKFEGDYILSPEDLEFLDLLAETSASEEARQTPPSSPMTVTISETKVDEPAETFSSDETNDESIPKSSECLELELPISAESITPIMHCHMENVPEPQPQSTSVMHVLITIPKIEHRNNNIMTHADIDPLQRIPNTS